MHILKRLFRTFISSIFKTLLFLTAVIAAITMLATKPETIKSTLSSSKAYDNVVDAVIESSADALDKDKKQNNTNNQPNNPGPGNNGNQNQNKEEEKSLDINRPEVVSAAKTAFTPAFLQTSTEEFIDGMFNWATGKTAEPDFSIDFGPAKTTFINSLADNAVARASTLPVCTAAQLPANGDFDPLNDTCLPPGTDLANISTSIKNDLGNSEDFLADTTLTSEIFKEDGESKLPDFVPTIYKLVSLAPLALGGLAILFAFFLWLLHERKRDGLKSIAISLTGVGIFILINTLLLDFLFKQINHSNKVLSLDNATRQLALGVIDSLNTNVNKSLYIFGGSYIALGVVILFILFITGRKNRSQSTSNTSNRPEARPVKTGNTPAKTMPVSTPSKPTPSAPPLPKRTKR